MLENIIQPLSVITKIIVFFLFFFYVDGQSCSSGEVAEIYCVKSALFKFLRSSDIFKATTIF